MFYSYTTLTTIFFYNSSRLIFKTSSLRSWALKFNGTSMKMITNVSMLNYSCLEFKNRFESYKRTEYLEFRFIRFNSISHSVSCITSIVFKWFCTIVANVQKNIKWIFNWQLSTSPCFTTMRGYKLSFTYDDLCSSDLRIMYVSSGRIFSSCGHHEES